MVLNLDGTKNMKTTHKILSKGSRNIERYIK
jgi:hypothetical protein